METASSRNDGSLAPPTTCHGLALYEAHACRLAMPLATEANAAWLAGPDRNILQYPTCKQLQGDLGCIQSVLPGRWPGCFKGPVRARKGTCSRRVAKLRGSVTASAEVPKSLSLDARSVCRASERLLRLLVTAVEGSIENMSSSRFLASGGFCMTLLPRSDGSGP